MHINWQYFSEITLLAKNSFQLFDPFPHRSQKPKSQTNRNKTKNPLPNKPKTLLTEKEYLKGYKNLTISEINSLQLLNHVDRLNY